MDATADTPSRQSRGRRKRNRRLGWMYRRGNVWTVQYSFQGKVYRESGRPAERGRL